MDFTITTDGINGVMTFDAATGIGNNVYLSLVIDQGSLFVNPAFGSRLYLLKRAKNTERTRMLAEEYCREALQWLITTGRATGVEIQSERDALQNPSRLKLLVSVTDAGGRLSEFSYFVEVV